MDLLILLGQPSQLDLLDSLNFQFDSQLMMVSHFPKNFWRGIPHELRKMTTLASFSDVPIIVENFSPGMSSSYLWSRLFLADLVSRSPFTDSPLISSLNISM